MARRPRQISASGVYHFINRGINKKHLFHHANDYIFWLKLVEEYKERFQIKIYHYCLMTNHTHFLVHSNESQSLSKFAYFIQRRYAYYYCKTYHWAGQVFQNRFKSIAVEDDAYLLECGRYIERNPLGAGLAVDPKDYLHSSYNFYANARPDSLLTPNPLYENLGRDLNERMIAYRAYVCQPRQKEAELSEA